MVKSHVVCSRFQTCNSMQFWILVIALFANKWMLLRRNVSIRNRLKLFVSIVMSTDDFVKFCSTRSCFCVTLPTHPKRVAFGHHMTPLRTPIWTNFLTNPCCANVCPRSSSTETTCLAGSCPYTAIFRAISCAIMHT